MRSRIAMLSLHTCPLASEEGKETGGLNVYVLALSKELAKQGYEIDIFTRIQSVKDPKIVHVATGIRVIHLKCGPQARISKKHLTEYIPEFVISFQKFASEDNSTYDLFHCHYYLSGIAGLMIRKLLNKPFPLVLTFHTLGLMKNLVARDELEREEKTRIEAEIKLTKEADHIIASSESDRAYLISLYNCPTDKITVIHPGVDTSIFTPMPKEMAKAHLKLSTHNNKIILFVGRIEPLKGIDVLLYATKILLERNPMLNICLIVVGGDISQKKKQWSRELKRLEEIRKTLYITTTVTFVGQKKQHDLSYYYNTAEFVVMPSHYESFGMAALEAMACGVPVITTNVTGISSILDRKHERLVTSANNPLLLASKMEYLLTNAHARETLGKQVLQRVQDLRWTRVAIKTIKVYKKFLT